MCGDDGCEHGVHVAPIPEMSWEESRPVSARHLLGDGDGGEETTEIGLAIENIDLEPGRSGELGKTDSYP